MIAAVLASFAFQTPGYVAEQYHDWFFHFFDNDRSDAAMRDWYRDLQILFRVYFWPLPPRVYYVGSAIVGLMMALFVYCRHRVSFDRRELFLFAAALGGCWVTVFGPATESCTYLLLAPMLAIGLIRYRNWSAKLAALAYGILAVTIGSALFPNNWKFQALGPQPIAALVFLAVVLFDSITPMTRARIMSSDRDSPTAETPIAA
jgi:hypothetical protein